MDKQIRKRHKRQVLRASARISLSEPDIRTPEQVRAAREASRPGGLRGNVTAAHHAMPSNLSQTGSEKS
jgi:hypothetical protein